MRGLWGLAAIATVLAAACDTESPVREEPLDVPVEDTAQDVVADSEPPDTALDGDDVDNDTLDTAPAPVCGNGLLEPGEGCDDGNQDDTDACPDGPMGTCQPARCGDGLVQLGVESCEPDATLPDGLKDVEGCNDDCTLECKNYRADCNGLAEDGCEANVGGSPHCGTCNNDCGDVPCIAAVGCNYGYLCSVFGVYDDAACDHATCGTSGELCEDSHGGCNCGAHRNYVEGVGCRLDDSCGPAPLHHCVTGAIGEPGVGRQCDTDEDCLDVPDGICAFGMCTHTCVSDGECATGTTCRPDPCDADASVCLPDGCCSGLVDDEQCSADEVCDLPNSAAQPVNACVSGRYLPLGSCLQRCGSDSDCPADRPDCVLIHRESDDFVEPFRVCVGPLYPAGLIDR